MQRKGFSIPLVILLIIVLLLAGLLLSVVKFKHISINPLSNNREISITAPEPLSQPTQESQSTPVTSNYYGKTEIINDKNVYINNAMEYKVEYPSNLRI